MARTEGQSLSSLRTQKSLRKELVQLYSRACSKLRRRQNLPEIHQSFTGTILVPSPVPSPIPHQKQLQFHAVPSPAPKKKLRSLKRQFRAPNSAEAPLEEVIRRPLLPAPNEETWIAELGIPF
ncbi:hypothetical protein CK203_050689 [Vitis vinifera]|uniref:Uncharacterized protein n=1 Tax=Vitis vinifera TaxID=29760 RepID=A0A438H8Q5_VITVI|nr:hypothetical protein CK203_050689 [Vitis vinifera]